MESSDYLARRPLHVVFFPFMAMGHMPPMVDMANLFAARGGVAATVVTTPPTPPRRLPPRPGANIGLRILPFPPPPHRLSAAVPRLREPFSRLLHEIRPIDVVVSDFFCPWTIPVAEELSILRLVFDGTVSSPSAPSPPMPPPLGGGDTVVLGGLPHRVVMLRSQIEDSGKLPPAFQELLGEIVAMDGRSYGTVVNSFYELEPDYVRHFREAMGHRAWHVGPIALFGRGGALLQQRLHLKEKQKDEEEAQERKEQAHEPTGSSSYLLEWLDRNPPVTMESSDYLARRPLHVVFFPFMATGHMPPMVDMANLFAARGGVATTIVATPANAPSSTPAASPAPTSASASSPSLPCPHRLPPGIENIAELSDLDSVNRFMVAVPGLREPFSRLLREIRPVDAVISDYFFPWTIPVAEELGIPRLVFHGTGFFALCATAAPATPLGSSDTVVLGSLPSRVVMLRSQMPDRGKSPPAFRELFGEIATTEGRSFGTVVNSFYELEPDYIRHFREAMGHRAWHVAPLHSSVGTEPSFKGGSTRKKNKKMKKHKNERAGL
uniref:Scopoletin glucosyltransferase n=1 Tax=Ananas comosus var. bracteatus TaxID=296719 RepID=A0A6V7Q513_ANACO|nr:unnamed protein product [Ananas comosus var. bracteatus]